MHQCGGSKAVMLITQAESRNKTAILPKSRPRRTAVTSIRASLARESTRAISKSGVDAALLNVERVWRGLVELRARKDAVRGGCFSSCDKHGAATQQRRSMKP